MKKNNILLVSLAFPPKACPESIQTARYFHYLKNKIGKIQVITAGCPSLFMPYDESLMKYFPSDLPVVQIKRPESKYVNYIIRNTFPALLELPDNKIHFSFFINNIVKRLTFKPDVLYSRSFPLTSAFIASKIQKKLKIPWVIHLSDPWSLSPIEFRTTFAQKYNEKKEFEFFNQAQHISFTTQETKDRYIEKFPEFSEKFVVFPNVYDPTDLECFQDSVKLNDKLVFTYTGGLANTRSCEPLLKSLKTLFHSNPELFDDVIFNFAGSFDRKNKKLIDDYDLPFLNNLGLISNEKAKEISGLSDILILIDTYFENSKDAMFLPSKLFDYLLTGNKILAITNKDSAVYKIVNDKFGTCIEHTNIEYLMNYFYDEIINFKNQKEKTNYPTNREMLSKYSAEINSTRLASLLNSL